MNNVKIPFKYYKNESSGWIPVKTGVLPEEAEPVLVCTESGIITAGEFYYGIGFVIDEYEDSERVIAWSYLPKPYEED